MVINTMGKNFKQGGKHSIGVRGSIFDGMTGEDLSEKVILAQRLAGG